MLYAQGSVTAGIIGLGVLVLVLWLYGRSVD